MTSVTDTVPTASDIRDVIINGSGPAGYTAPLHTAHTHFKPLPFGSIFVGGSPITTTKTENSSASPTASTRRS